MQHYSRSKFSTIFFLLDTRIITIMNTTKLTTINLYIDAAIIHSVYPILKSALYI